MSKTMLAAVLHGIQDLRVDERAVPELDPGTVLVRMRRGGQVVQIGVFSAEEISLPVNQLLIGEFQFLGSFRYGPVFDEAIRLVASNRVNLRPLISRVFPLREANAALTLACAKNDAVKVQIDLT